MAKQVKVIGIKRQRIDDEKLALAFLLLAKTLREPQHDHEPTADNKGGAQEAA